MRTPEVRRVEPDELREAMADASVPVLLMVLTHLTGDGRWLEPPFRPKRSRGLDDDPTGGLTDDVQSTVRTAAHEAVLRWADGAPPAITVPDRDLLLRMMNVCAGEDVPAEYGDLLLEELRADRASEPSAQKLGFSVAVIGAGVSGLLAAAKLREAGISCTVFERSDDIGGTWLYNCYPGSGVDTPSYLYSFSFFPWDWSAHFGRRDEILEYLRTFADHFGVRECIELRTEVVRATYLADRQRWLVRTRCDDKEREREFNAVISAVGQLNVPSIPDLPGRKLFPGPVFHSAEWPSDLNVTGRRVAVVGTGASAMQIVPTIAPDVEKLIVFQSSPHWIAPNPNMFGRVPPTMHYLMHTVPFYRSWYRFRLGWIYNDRVHASLQVDPSWPHPERSLNAVNDRHREYFTNYLREQLKERPDLQAKVLPNYPPFAKRMLLDHGWYTAIRRDNVEVVTDRVAEFTSAGVRSKRGVEYPVDVVVLATGFQATKLVQTVDVVGRSGATLREVWGDDDAWAYLGITVPDFPNFFLLYGPGTSSGSGGSYIFIAECQMNYIVRLIQLMVRRKAAAVECRREVCEEYNKRVDEAHARMVWTHPGVSNYYRNAKGRVVTNSPWRFIDYWHLTREPNPDDFLFEDGYVETRPAS